MKEKSFQNMVKEEWSEMKVEGWRAYILKEKIKG